MTKKYTLELTAEELETGLDGMYRSSVVDKFLALQEQRRKDREAADLRLPWRVSKNGWYGWAVHDADGSSCNTTERAAKIRAAAPELFEAVQAMKRCWEGDLANHQADDYERVVEPLIDRALRKVSTGVPE
jgi:hypothetical protein